MSTDLLQEYQRWAKRGYVEPLTCAYHPEMYLFASETVEGTILWCPRMDYNLRPGAALLKRLERKLEMAKYIFENGKI